MLTLKEVRWSFKCFHICTKLKFLPARLNKIGKIDIPEPRSKFWGFLLLLCLVHNAFLVLNFFNYGFRQKSMEIQDIPMHLFMTLFMGTGILITGSLFLAHPDITSKIFNQLYWNDYAGQLPDFMWLNCSLQELFLIFLPFAIFSPVLLYLGLVVVDPLKSIFWFSIIPMEYRNILTFTVMLTAEVLVLLFMFSSLFLCGFLLLSSFEYIRSEMQVMNRIADFKFVTHEALLEILERATHLRQFILLFNICNRFNCFCIKFFCLSPIILFFFSLRFYHQLWFESLVGAFVGIDLTLIYVIAFDKAFAIPELFEDLKKQVKFATTKVIVDRRFRGCVHKKMESICNVGIQVGDFHVFKRESTPEFLNFVFVNVMSLIIGFK